jgi:hypothetical protein
MTVNQNPVNMSLNPSTNRPADPLVDRTGPEGTLHEEAVKRLREKADFRIHVMMYVLVNGMLVLIWAMTGANFFWPAFPIAGWGVGLVAHAMEVYWKHEPTEAEIASEMDRLRHR